jgi:uncharacterized integral membrane protein (TIGR00698 family)
MKKYFWGLSAALCIAALARVTGVYIPGPGEVCWAIVIGMICGNLLPFGERMQPGLAVAEKRILPLAIALMGTELQLHTLGNLGFSALLVVIPAMVISIAAALWIGRWLKLPVRAALLLGIGNSVCGSSAVMAAAPALKAEKHEIAVAVASVNVAGTIGMFVLPALAVLWSLSDAQTSYLLGGSLQAVGQVVAAGFSVSDSVGNDALVIKMLRVLMIGPIVMILHWVFRSKDGADGAKKKYIPGYIIGFILCAAAAAIFDGEARVLPLVRNIAKLLMVVAMAGVGCRIHLRSLLAQGPKALVMVAVLSVLQAGMVLVLVRVFASA